MNSVALMVALMGVPDAASFGGGCGSSCSPCGDPCGNPCGKTGLFHGRIRAFFAKCNLFKRCRSKNACWAPPSSCCGGGFETGGIMAGFDGMPMGGMPMAGGMPMGMEGMSGGEVFSGGMPMGQPGGNCPSCQAGQQQQFGGYPMAMNQQSFAPSQSFAPNGVAMVQGGEYAGGQPTYQQQSYGPGVSAYPTQMPGQGGFQGQPQAGQTWMAPQGGPGATAPLLGQPNPVRQTAPPIQSPSPIPPSGSGAALPFGAFPGTAPASAVAPAHAFGGEDFAPARLRFQVPAGAVVFVDGQKVDGTGPVRKFHTPTLPRGRTFFYEFRAEFEVNGVKVVEEKVLPVCAGDELNETFAKLASAAK